MDYLNEKTLSLSKLKQTAWSNPGFALFCLLFFIFMELFFIVFPPRGFIAEDYFILGSIRGQALISIENLWENKINNDQFMLEILEKSGIKKFSDKTKALAYLNNEIRTNLRFARINNVLFKISFIQPSAENIRPFLNTFSESFLAEISQIAEEELKNRRKNANFQLRQLNRRSYFTYNLFNPESSYQEIVVDPARSLTENATFSENSFSGKAGLLILNELNDQLYSAIVSAQRHNDESQKILSIFPFKSRKLTDPEMPPRPVQPFLIIFYIFIAFATLLLYLAGLVYLLPASKKSDLQDNASV
ncbi:MAG: hypothetical protein Kow0029_04650 [Candidatus Rifleibacteriota bacterium]